jgi:hypothetical protein
MNGSQSGLLTALALAIGVALPAAAGQPADPDLAGAVARAGIDDRIEASCRGAFRGGHDREFAVAFANRNGGGRYVVVHDDGTIDPLSDYSGKPDLTCYSVTEADRLNATIARSDTINGRVVAEWDGVVVCGFIEPTIAVCWQFAQEQKRFVRIGGWTS